MQTRPHPTPGARAPATAAGTAEVAAVERKIGAVLADLEADTGGEVKDIDLHDVVDTDASGRPVVKKKVEVHLQARPERRWAT
jgi:hypothetical protein